MISKTLSVLVAGLILSFLGSALATFGLSFLGDAAGKYGAYAFIGFFLLSIAIAVSAPTGGKSWRRLFLISAVVSFLLPIATMIFSGAQITGTETGAEAAGAAIGGGLVTALTGFVSFFIGAVFLIIGLLTGRDKQVVYVREESAE